MSLALAYQINFCNPKAKQQYKTKTSLTHLVHNLDLFEKHVVENSWRSSSQVLNIIAGHAQCSLGKSRSHRR